MAASDEAITISPIGLPIADSSPPPATSRSKRRRIAIAASAYLFYVSVRLFKSTYVLTASSDEMFQIANSMGFSMEQLWNGTSFGNTKIDPTPPKSIFSIFYNIYIPSASDNFSIPLDAALVKEIVQEQIGLIADSDAARTFDQIRLNYITVGCPNVINATFVTDLCNSHQGRLKCHHVRHENIGNEELTLQMLWEHCRRDGTPPDERVAYIHSKGTFHSKTWNGLTQGSWRRHGTRTVVRKECFDPPNPLCNMCSMMSTLWPYVSGPGNFFTAKCDYVKKLYPPNEFQEAMAKINATRQMLTDVVHKFELNLLPVKDSNLGVDRYANEHWVGSNPEVQPCDMSDTYDMSFWQKTDQPDEAFKWEMQPRSSTPSILKHLRTRDKTTRLKDYFLLGGYLYKWYTLYGRGPPSDSWVWEWFPFGAEWKEAVENYGAHAMDVLLAIEANRTRVA
ncbi:hypothetical protein MPSEU_000396700 [Mayamaea pseudoterrestris]|nr:hypothetical protein MPSEU_000396700 [Mayamaea pseudoterrestris]